MRNTPTHHSSAAAEVLIFAGLLTCLFLPAGCLSPRPATKDPAFAPIYVLDVEGEPVIFKALRGRSGAIWEGGVTLAFYTRPGVSFIARPIYSSEGGQLLRFASAQNFLNLGYVPPGELPALARFMVSVDWVVRGGGGYRDSGVTQVLLEVSPDADLKVVHAENRLDSRRSPDGE